MKSFFYKTLVGTAAAASSASALSLYDTAPMVGLPESQSAKYYFSTTLGYDTNPQCGVSSRNKEKKASAYVSANLRTSYADVESVNKLSYTAQLGGSRYLNSGDYAGRRYSANCGLSASLEHAFSAMSNYKGALHVTYTPEPGYDNGVSSAGMRGDSLSWNFNNTYAQAIDSRWSWNLGANLSGTKYERRTYTYDDRQYYSASGGLNYRSSDLLTYTTSVSWRDELRSYGVNSRSVFASGGVQYALDPVSSVSLSVGAQCKMMAHRHTLNPTLDAGYRRRVSDGLSMNAYVKYSDENTDNYSRSANASYRTGGTWRAGAYGTYVLSPDVSFVFRMQVMQTEYGKSTSSSMNSSSRYSLDPSVTMNYHFTPELMGTMMAEFSHYCYKNRPTEYKYNRWKLSAGLSYSF